MILDYHLSNMDNIPAIEASENDEMVVTVAAWVSDLDGTLVVQVDTEQAGRRIRINLNDAPVWDGNPETDERPGSYFNEEF